jgi:hypothetical protein
MRRMRGPGEGRKANSTLTSFLDGIFVSRFWYPEDLVVILLYG